MVRSLALGSLRKHNRLVLGCLLVLFGISILLLASRLAKPLEDLFFYELRAKWVSAGVNRDDFRFGKVLEFLHIIGITISGLGGGLLLHKLTALELPWRDRRIRLLGGGAVIASALFVFLLSYRASNLQFGAVDQALSIELGWRQVSGQAPYQDFICTLPPVVYLGARVAFQVLGVSYRSLALLTSFYALFIFAWCYWLLRGLLDELRNSILVALLIVSTGMLSVSFWWYNPVTVGAVSVTLLSALRILRDGSRVAFFSYAAALVLLAGSKPNVAAIVILGTVVSLALSRRARIGLLLSCGISFVAFVGILALFGVSFSSLLDSYLQVASRGRPSFVAVKDLILSDVVWSLLAILMVLLPLLPYAVELKRKEALSVPSGPGTIGVHLTAFFAAFYSMVAHGEVKLVDCSILSVACILPVLIRARNARIWAWSCSVGLICLAAFVGYARTRVSLIGYGAFFEWKLANSAVSSGFFAGVRGSDRFARVIAQLEAIRTKNPTMRIYFGPRLEWAYAATSSPSPRGIPPLLWHTDTFHRRDQEPQIISRILSSHDLLVFMRRDYGSSPTSFWTELGLAFDLDTDRTEANSELMVFRRK